MTTLTLTDRELGLLKLLLLNANHTLGCMQLTEAFDPDYHENSPAVNEQVEAIHRQSLDSLFSKLEINDSDRY